MKFAGAIRNLGFSLVLLLFACAVRSQTSVYEIPFKGPAQLQRLAADGIEVLAATADGKLHVVAKSSDKVSLARWGATPHLLQTPQNAIADIDENLGQYRTYDEMVTVITDLQANYPSLVQIFSIGTSLEGRTIWAVKVSDNVSMDESEPELLIQGCLHSRELMAVEQPLKFLEHIVNNYADPSVQPLVDSREIFFIPICNPDGYVYLQNNHGGNWWNWWRKNRRDNGDGTFGVDLNRNYGHNWGHDDIGSSPATSSNLYRGTALFSEPETAAIRDFTNARNFVSELSYHSYGNLLLYPWGFEYSYATDHAIFKTMAERMVAVNSYLPGNPAMGAIYLTNGGSDDWAYGDTSLRDKIYSFTPEVGSAADGGFGPAESFIEPYFDALLDMNMTFLDIGGEPEKVLGPVQPVIQSVAANQSGELILEWSENIPADPNPAVTYELEYFRNLELAASLDAESPSSIITLSGGFATSTTRSQEGNASYYSSQGDNLSSTLMAMAPFRVTAGNANFDAWLWYDIETDWDYAYVEVSEDEGLIWQPIAGSVTTNDNPNGANRGNGITGSSGGWVQASFPLNDYIGQEILLRIHYSTDGAVINEGIYVDLFGPVPTFEVHAPIAAGISGTSHNFDPGTPATYSYRVRGEDAEADLGRWSNTFDVVVDNATDISPRSPLEHRLGQNFPNPFNPSTSIPFTVGSRDAVEGRRQVQLSVFDAQGRQVARVVDGYFAPGHYRESWNGRRSNGELAPSGQYFARLRIDGVTSNTRKLVLLK